MNLRHIEAIIFDAEGVVVNTGKLWGESREILPGKRGPAYDRDYLKPGIAEAQLSLQQYFSRHIFLKRTD